MQGHNLLTARFTNNARTTIFAEWQDIKDPSVIRAQYMEAKENNVQYKELLKHMDLSVIHQNTKDYYRKANKRIMKHMEQVYKESTTVEGIYKSSSITRDAASVELSENISKQNMTSLMKIIPKILFDKFDSKEYMEALFNLKITIFELDFVKESKNRILKSEIRKAKTPLEVLNGVMGIYNEIHNGPNNAKSNKKVSSASS
tara:strand:+ start:13 stop:618 length:606 start_codon:yes stop_codon:yes gene_type:complete